MASEFALRTAIQIWTTEKNKEKVMDNDLVETFANTIDALTSQAWLGNATTGQLLEELKARFQMQCKYGLNYKTVLDK